MMKHTGCSTPASVTVRAAMNMMASQCTKHFTHSIKRIKANHEKIDFVVSGAFKVLSQQPSPKWDLYF